MSEGDDLKLHVSIGEVAIEVEGPVDEAETWFEALREDYLADVDGATVAEAATASSTTDKSPTSQDTNNPQGKTRTLAEFYQTTDGLSKKDTALLTGWYLEKHENQDDFTRPEIEEMAQSAKLTLGKNVGRDIGYQVEDGYLAEVDERDGDTAYYVTLTGEEYVENELLGV